MDRETRLFFNQIPQALPLYKTFAENILAEYPDVQIKIQKTQISFSNKYPFAYVWLPIRKMKNRPEIYIVVSFVLPDQLESPRIVEATQSYPNRWVHHLIIQHRSEVDRELMNWMKEAYEFAMKK